MKTSKASNGHSREDRLVMERFFRNRRSKKSITKLDLSETVLQMIRQGRLKKGSIRQRWARSIMKLEAWRNKPYHIGR